MLWGQLSVEITPKEAETSRFQDALHFADRGDGIMLSEMANGIMLVHIVKELVRKGNMTHVCQPQIQFHPMLAPKVSCQSDLVIGIVDPPAVEFVLMKKGQRRKRSPSSTVEDLASRRQICVPAFFLDQTQESIYRTRVSMQDDSVHRIP